MKYYDSKNKRLVFLSRKATPSFWDDLWKTKCLRKNVMGRYDVLVVPTTRKYLKKGSKILEGGCGTGRFVYRLHKNGYNSIGVDFAKKTISLLRKELPELDFRYGDVRKLPFENNFFDGYWSLGVIEHFYEGYDKIVQEMHRVLRKGGYAFVTFPYMSPLRKQKAGRGSYKNYTLKSKPKNFYQFALNSDDTIKLFEKAGFSLVKKKPYSGYKGLKDESKIARFFLKPISKGEGFLVQAVRYCISLVFSRFSGHTVLLVFKKMNK